jgi:hypothetical protein
VALLGVLGPTAIGVGMFAGGVAVAVSVGTAVRRQVRVPIAGRTAAPALVATAASVAGWLVADALGRGIPAFAASLATALTIYGAGVLLLRGKDVRMLLGLLRGALRRR